MMRIKFGKGFILSIFLVICFAKVAFSTNYYADADNGNNSWDGKAPTFEGGSRGPWKTGMFPASLAAGDQLLYKRGTKNLYTTRFVNYWNGSAVNVITIGAWGRGAKPKLCCATVANSARTNTASGVYTQASVSCTLLLEDLKAIDHATDANLTDGNWYFNGSTIYYKPTSGVPGDHDLRYVFAAGGDSVNIGLYKGASYITIQDLTLIGSNINATANIDNARVHHLTIQRCDFKDICADALYLVSQAYRKLEYITITGCTFNYCLNNIYLVAQNRGACENVTIRRNSFLNSNKMRGTVSWDWAGGGDRDGISIQNIKDSTIEYNEVSGLCHLGGGITIWFDSAYRGTGNIIRYNYVHDVTGGGIIWGGCDVGHCNTQIYGNIVVNAGLTMQALPSWSATGDRNTRKTSVSTKILDVTEDGTSLIERSSIIMVNANAGSWYWDGEILYVRATSGTPDSNRKAYVAKKVYANPGGQSGGITLNRVQTSLNPTTVYNNTVYHCNVNYCITLGDYFILKNNISMNPVLAHTTANAGVLHNIFDLNCYYPATGSLFNYEYHDKTWFQWKTLTKIDSHSITSNPQFLDAANGDFRLNTGSPCIKAGTNVGLSTDYFGNKFRSTPSMGAIEYY